MVVIALALAAAALSALSAAGEQRAASRLARRSRSRRRPGPYGRASGGWRRGRGLSYAAAFAVALLSTPLWVGSWIVDAGSFFVQAAALHLGSLSVVQPLMVATLLFSLPLAALGSGRRPSTRDWAGAVGVCAGLVLVLSTRESPTGETAHEATLLPAMGAVIAVAVALVALARGRSASMRAALLSVAAGGLFAVGAATTKLTAATAATSGFTGLLTSWPGYALAAVSLASFALQQAAYVSGPLAPAVTAVVITDPLVSYLLGVVGYGEPLPDPGGPLILAVLGTAVLIAGVAALAHSPLLHPPRESAPVLVPPALRTAEATDTRQHAPAAQLAARWVTRPDTRQPCHAAAGCAEGP